jgi:uncharacterized protein (DUF362 family)
MTTVSPRNASASAAPLPARERVVAVAKARRASYGRAGGRDVLTVAQLAVRDLFIAWQLDAAHIEDPAWNPLGDMIPPGSKVVVKPNWVTHAIHDGGSFDCLVTHPTMIEAVLEYVARTDPASVIVGDAPLQGCDFEALRQACDLDGVVRRSRDQGLNVSIADFRRTVLDGQRLGRRKTEDRQPLDDYVLFDLQRESLLEELAGDAANFRVTMYNPDLLVKTHAPCRHKYLIARPVLDADVVINLPKLKCHKKACVTGALKNLVGINGNKEYLPHHRKGSAVSGGDCYANESRLKYWAEDLLDAANRRPAGVQQAALGIVAQALLKGAKLRGDAGDVEGSWYGNDTVWRMCLDLQRILRFGDVAGRLHPAPVRRVITITDAIIGGEGEGPLAPTPVPSAFVTGGENPAAVDWVNATLMGFDPRKIPLIHRAFDRSARPLAPFSPAMIEIRADPGPLPSVPFRPARGWLGHCELDAR